MTTYNDSMAMMAGRGNEEDTRRFMETLRCVHSVEIFAGEDYRFGRPDIIARLTSGRTVLVDAKLDSIGSGNVTVTQGQHASYLRWQAKTGAYAALIAARSTKVNDPFRAFYVQDAPRLSAYLLQASHSGPAYFSCYASSPLLEVMLEHLNTHGE